MALTDMKTNFIYSIIFLSFFPLCSCSNKEGEREYDAFNFYARECNAVSLFHSDTGNDSLSILLCVSDDKMKSCLGFKGEIKHYARQEEIILRQLKQDVPLINNITISDEPIYGLYSTRAEYRMEQLSSINFFSTNEIMNREPNTSLNDLFSLSGGGINGMKPLVLYWYSDFLISGDGERISHLTDISSIDKLVSSNPMVPASLLFVSSFSKKVLPDNFSLGVEVILENGKALRDTLHIVK